MEGAETAHRRKASRTYIDAMYKTGEIKTVKTYDYLDASAS